MCPSHNRLSLILTVCVLALLSLAFAAPTKDYPRLQDVAPSVADNTNAQPEHVQRVAESFGERVYRRLEELMDMTATSTREDELELVREPSSGLDAEDGFWLDPEYPTGDVALNAELETNTPSPTGSRVVQDEEGKAEEEENLVDEANRQLELQEEARLTRRSLDNLSNAQRMARGLPLRKPNQMYDHRLGARAPAPSEARKP